MLRNTLKGGVCQSIGGRRPLQVLYLDCNPRLQRGERGLLRIIHVLSAHFFHLKSSHSLGPLLDFVRLEFVVIIDRDGESQRSTNLHTEVIKRNGRQ